MQIRPAVAADAGEVLTLQRAAFVKQAQSHNDVFLPPLVETLEEIEQAIAAGEVLVGREGSRLVGTVRRVLKDGELHIGRLAVAPDLEGRGLGSQLLAAAENTPGADVAVLFTGHLAAGNLAMYFRRGYREFDRRRQSDNVEVIFLRKPLGAAN